MCVSPHLRMSGKNPPTDISHERMDVEVFIPGKHSSLSTVVGLHRKGRSWFVLIFFLKNISST